MYPNPYAMAPYVGGPCGPAAFDALTLQRSAMAGAIGALAPVTLIGLGDDCPPLLPPVPEFVVGGVTTPATEGDICEACCSPQGCFCVTKITIPNCGPCIFLLTSIKSGRCEILECGSVMADSFYCDCDPPPVKTSMLQPGLEFCITAQNVCNVVIPAGATAPEIAALIAECTFRFRATLYGISTDEPCRPCLDYFPPYGPPAQIPPPVFTPPPSAQIPRPVYTPPGFVFQGAPFPAYAPPSVPPLY